MKAPQSHAQNKFDNLTDGNIRFFIEDMTEITSAKSDKKSSSRSQAFLKRHLHPNARFKSTLQYTIPGYPPQITSLSLDKSEFIQNMQSGSQMLENYDTDVIISDIKISNDKTKAVVKTNGYESGTMSMEDEQIPVEGNSNCVQIIMLSKKGVIQMYNATCETSITFKKF